MTEPLWIVADALGFTIYSTPNGQSIFPIYGMSGGLCTNHILYAYRGMLPMADLGLPLGGVRYKITDYPKGQVVSFLLYPNENIEQQAAELTKALMAATEKSHATQ